MSKYKTGEIVKVYPPVDDCFLPMMTGVIKDYGTHLVPGKPNYMVHDIKRLDDPKMFTITDESCLRRAYTHISPSALFLFEKNPQEMYMKYVARYRAPSLQQTQPMSIGSSFDAYVKSFVIKALAKGGEVNPLYEFEALFNAQVESHNRDWGRKAGLFAFEAYKTSGALSDIFLEITQGDKHPQFEFEVKGLVKSDGYEVPLLGKPDLYFVNKHGAQIVGDWKVNGFCAKTPVSPKGGYTMVRDGWVGNNTKSHRIPHKDTQVQTIKGIEVNVAATMEMINAEWATQLSCYAWLMGAPVGSPFIAALEQLACGASNKIDQPNIRVASYRNLVSNKFQFEVFARFKKCHQALTSGHFFTDVSRMESDMKCLDLEKMARTLQPTGDAAQDWLNNVDRVR